VISELKDLRKHGEKPKKEKEKKEKEKVKLLNFTSSSKFILYMRYV